MKDEIKEILFLLHNDRLTDSGKRKLVDYITNLQEKVNQYENPDDMTLFYMWLDEKAKDKIKQLQEENERLKELCDKYEEEHSTTFEYWKNQLETNKHPTLLQGDDKNDNLFFMESTY